ncbi:MAG: zinc ABC transporter substrate-binding protein [Clostridia bacterium]|nr:zinc ABC transporter substrate-binding protein [Clostridia bacterium]
MKRILGILLLLSVMMLLVSGCTAGKTASDDKLKIVATMFPQYDFCRELCGDSAEITLLLPPGVESHSYDPAPADIMKIIDCDIFIYTGPEMEGWAETILSGVGDDVTVVDLSKSVELICDQHEHDEHDTHEHDGHHHAYDPHIWTTPYNASLMTQAICEALCSARPENADYFKANCDIYCSKLMDLDSELFEISKNAKRNTIVFGGRFAFAYFADRYGFNWEAAYDSCSHESEPSVGKVAELIDLVNEQKIPVVFYEELVDPAAARVIAAESGAKILLLHSAHNLSKDELESGATYLSIMENNIENLREGLF